jgi:hypothetical protein
MPDHDPRLRRLNAPNPDRTITAPPRSNHGVRLPGGGGLSGPVEASAVATDGETDGASACITGGDAAVAAAEVGGGAVAT